MTNKCGSVVNLHDQNARGVQQSIKAKE